MFYRFRRALNTRRFDRNIAGILETKPLVVRDGPWAIVSMVANRDVPMYLAAIKSFYLRIGRGKIVAIVDRDMPPPLRETLSHHLPGIEFVILEDIPTSPCQRGGTWERLLYCLDRSEREFTIQLDSDTLAVSDLNEVVECLHANRAFTMSDGFSLVPLLKAAEQAQSTPSNRYIGIVSEAMFDRYPGRENLRYIRGSSGFAGFAKGGFTRSAIASFHQHMESLIGEARWREWGSEQCGSNFAIANSPDPMILPYPEYASFDHHVPRATVKFYHFIGRFRFAGGYFARRAQETIAALTPGTAPVTPPQEPVTSGEDPGAFGFAQSLTPASLVSYAAWRMRGRQQPIVLELRSRTRFQNYPIGAPKFKLVERNRGGSGVDEARDVFVRRFYASPVWLPEQRVLRIVDLGAGNGMSCLWWLSIYWRAQVIALEPNGSLAEEIRANAALNNYGPRLTLHHTPVSPEGTSPAFASQPGIAYDARMSLKASFALLERERIDILKIDMPGGEVDLLSDRRFGALDLGAVVTKYRRTAGNKEGGRDWCISRLQQLGFRTYPSVDHNGLGVVWSYRS